MFCSWEPALSRGKALSRHCCAWDSTRSVSRCCSRRAPPATIERHKGGDMNGTRSVLAILGAGIASSLTDWFFMGDLLYKTANKHPEVWRFPAGVGESKAIAWSSRLPFLTCAVFVVLRNQLHLRVAPNTFKLALAIWLMRPLPLIATNALFMKVQPMIAAAHSLGWLVKLSLAAL